MFACRQLYVTSRVMAIEGLHLITFDPCLIKASAESVHEYNRLKEKQ